MIRCVLHERFMIAMCSWICVMVQGFASPPSFAFARD
jgi:hypothetical protein